MTYTYLRTLYIRKDRPKKLKVGTTTYFVIKQVRITMHQK